MSARPVLGNDRKAQAARQREGVQTMERRAIKPKREIIAPSNNFSPIFSNKREAKREFSALVLKFENGELATDGDVSKETVKCWKAARAIPQGPTLMLLMKNNPRIRAWVLAKAGIREMPEFLNDPRVLTAMMAMAYQGTYQNNPDGDAIREAIGNHLRGMPT